MLFPEEWLTPEARRRARIPATVGFQEKWRLALTLLRQIRAAGFDVAYITDHDSVRAALDAQRANPTRAGDGTIVDVAGGAPNWTFTCPRHPDRDPGCG